MSTPTPGWYHDPSGAPLERYWDGQQWSQSTRPMPTAPLPPIYPSVPSVAQRKPWYTRKRVIIPAGVLVLLIVIGAIGSATSHPKSADAAKPIALSSSPIGVAPPITSQSAPAAPTTSSAPPSSALPSFDGMNLATAITEAQSAGLSPSDVGGGDFGIIVTSDWTVCFSATNGNSVTFFAAKGCSPDSNSESGSSAPSGFASGLTNQNLATAESTLSAHHYGYNEIGGGDLGIIVTSDWTVCYAANGNGAVDLFAAKDCTAAPAS